MSIRNKSVFCSAALSMASLIVYDTSTSCPISSRISSKSKAMIISSSTICTDRFFKAFVPWFIYTKVTFIPKNRYMKTRIVHERRLFIHQYKRLYHSGRIVGRSCMFHTLYTTEHFTLSLPLSLISNYGKACHTYCGRRGGHRHGSGRHCHRTGAPCHRHLCQL